jgi:hypothetical protein
MGSASLPTRETGSWSNPLARQRDMDHDVWARKRPAPVHYMDKVIPLLRRPSVVMIFRDLLAVSHRKQQVQELDYVDLFNGTASFYKRMAKLCGELSCPLMLVSYEGASKDPVRYTTEMAAFLGVTDPLRVDQAVAKQQANKEEYLRIQGNLLAERQAAQRASGAGQ